MISSVAARRYAKGLLQLAIEKGVISDQLADMQLIRNTFDANKELQRMLISPVIKDAKKKAIIEEIFLSRVTEMTGKLITLLTEKGRLNLLYPASVHFENLYNDYAGILEITITTAFELDKKQLDNVLAQFSKSVGLELKPTIKVDSLLMGGLTLSYRDTVIDGSVKNKLEQLSLSLKASAV